MRVTKRWIEKNEVACGELEDGLVWWERNKHLDEIKIIEKLVSEDRLGWANWFIMRRMKHKEYVAYAVYAAKQVLDIYEKQYPDDKRPRKAITAAQKYIKNPNNKNKAAAAYASYAAQAAANMAYGAAYAAAYAAADAAACAAGYAAGYAAANAAAYAAGYAAAYAAARKEMQLKILKHGIKILKKR